eukprot:5198708-Pleurochrysis_carterae.AAC.1
MNTTQTQYTAHLTTTYSAGHDPLLCLHAQTTRPTKLGFRRLTARHTAPRGGWWCFWSGSNVSCCGENGGPATGPLQRSQSVSRGAASF